MSIKLTPFSHDNLFFGDTWTVDDEGVLADQIAHVALGQSLHVQRILTGANIAAPPTTATTAAGAIKLLSVSGVDPWHRDGWMFQAMSWIAARVKSPDGVIRPPHMIHAHKGFDGLQLELDKDGGVIAAVIFEDKATDNPRDTIRDEVWPDFKKLEAGENENVLTAEVVALLQTRASINPDKAGVAPGV
jgi:hypothetical protein